MIGGRFPWLPMQSGVQQLFWAIEPKWGSVFKLMIIIEPGAGEVEDHDLEGLEHAAVRSGASTASAAFDQRLRHIALLVRFPLDAAATVRPALDEAVGLFAGRKGWVLGPGAAYEESP